MAMVFKIYLSPCTLELHDSDCRKHLLRGLIIWNVFVRRWWIWSLL